MPELERIRLDADTAARPGALRETLERFRGSGPRGADRDADGREGPPLPRRRPRGGRRRRHRASRSPTSAPRSERSSSSPSSRGAAAAMRPGLVLVQTFQPDAMPFQFAQRHDVAGFLAEELERRTALGYPPVSHLVTVVASGPDAAGVAQVLREVRDGARGRRGDAARAGAAAAAAGPPPGPARREDAASRARSRGGRRRCSPRRARRCAGAG